MPRPLDFFLFLGSTYTYLAVNRAETLATQAGIRLRWRPFSVRRILIEQDNSPFLGKPVKMAYMWRDLERRAARHGIRFASIPDYPIDPDELANRVATVAAAEGWCSAFVQAAYRLWFLENKDPGRVEHLAPLLASLGCDADAVIARANGAPARERYAAETDAARALGVFGSPTFACGTEIFWGDDRLEDAIEWCVTH